MNMSSRKVNFHPWKGPRYPDVKDSVPRILVLGESHYADEPVSVTFTQDLCEQYIAGQWRHRFWTQIGQVLSGKHHTVADPRDSWRGIAFYNYVQTISVSGPRQSPPDAAFDESLEAFREVLYFLKPSHIIVCGFRLWERLPVFDGEPDFFVAKNNEHQYGPYSTGRTTAVASPILHPSAGFSFSEWHPVVAKFLTIGI